MKKFHARLSGSRGTMSRRICLLIVTLCMLTGCISCQSRNGAVTDNAYHAGTDSQFFQQSFSLAPSGIQETEDGCVFVHQQFVYRFDIKQKKITPLCSKINCLHDEETDDEKKKNCNAYLENMITGAEVQLMLYKDHVFASYLGTDWSKMKYPTTIMRLSLDGSSREVFNEQSSMQRCMLHRGYIYYLTPLFTAGPDQIASSYPVLRISAEKAFSKPELIFQMDEHVIGAGNIFGFGNYVVFYYHISEESHFLFLFDQTTEEIVKVEYPRSWPAWFNEHIYGLTYLESEGFDYPSEAFFCTPGKDDFQKVELGDICQGNLILSDGRYLYINSGNIPEPDLGKAKRWRAYDENHEFVDEFILPESSYYYYAVPIGGEHYQYLVYEDESGQWGISVWDKSLIGSYHGKTVEPEIILY